MIDVSDREKFLEVLLLLCSSLLLISSVLNKRKTNLSRKPKMVKPKSNQQGIGREETKLSGYRTLK